MALEGLIVKRRERRDHFSFLGELISSESFFKRRDLNWFVVSSCPLQRRAWRDKFGDDKVINPFSFLLGELEEDRVISFIWLDEWPTLMGGYFEEFRYALFSLQTVFIMGQSFEAPFEAKRELRKFCGKREYLFKERCPSSALFSSFRWIGPLQLWRKREDFKLERKIFKRPSGGDTLVMGDAFYYSHLLFPTGPSFSQLEGRGGENLGIFFSHFSWTLWRSYLLFFKNIFSLWWRLNGRDLLDWHYGDKS